MLLCLLGLIQVARGPPGWALEDRKCENWGTTYRQSASITSLNEQQFIHCIIKVVVINRFYCSTMETVKDERKVWYFKYRTKGVTLALYMYYYLQPDIETLRPECNGCYLENFLISNEFFFPFNFHKISLKCVANKPNISIINVSLLQV